MIRRVDALVLFAFMFTHGGLAAAQTPKAPHPFNTKKRELWTTSKVRGTPEPPSPYVTELAFPNLKFNEPLSMARVPGSRRLAIAERPGKILTFEDQRDTDDKKLMLDVGRTVYGIALHPGYAENGYLFVTSELDGKIEVLRFQAKRPATFEVDPKTLTKIISWPADGHRGGCLRFGPDGHLYIGVGDGSGIADQLKTGQKIDDLLASMLRIDVNRRQKGKAYAIPADNPFVNTPGARGEVWAYGLRQPWKFSFDRLGRLWAGDVGQDLWEMIYIIRKGANYGWSVREGRHPFRPERPKGPTAFVDPLHEHPHSDFRSITGGYISHSDRIDDLRGEYIYADYDTGQVRGLRIRGGRVSRDRELVDTQLRIAEFGQDRRGDVLMVDFAGGRIHRLKTAPKSTQRNEFPTTLSGTGLFESTRKMIPAKGLIPYTVNSPLWSDGASKQRYIALPGDAKIDFETVVYPQGAPGAYPGWRFPHDTVFVKTFFLEMEKGNAASRRRLETRILHHKHMPGTDEYGAQFWRGYTYIWNDEQTDAKLADREGATRTFRVKDGDAPGGFSDRKWRFPSRAECTLCHTMAAKYALGVTTLQMNGDLDYGHGVIANQIKTLADLGVFSNPPADVDKLPRLVDYRDEGADLNLRARSYLDANCAHCHRKWGGGNAEFQYLATLPLTQTGTINVKPQQGRFDLNDPHVLVPGDPARSMTLFRMRKLGLGRMPHVASNVVDTDAVELMRKWIRQLGKGIDPHQKGVINPRREGE